MNHVPDDALAALDEFGEGLLVGDPPAVDERLREDLRLVVRPDAGGATARAAFRVEHGTAHDRLRGHGPFVGTVVDGVEKRLREWGVDPPDRYAHEGTDDGWQVYAGAARLL